MISYYRGILQLYLVKMRDSELYKFLYPNYDHENGLISCGTRLNSLYPYCFNDKGNIFRSEEYLQFINKSSNIERILCDYSCSDSIIEHELSESNFEDLFEGFPFNENIDLFKIHPYKSLSVPSPTSLIVCIEYSSYQTDCGEEYDTGMYIDSILDGNFNKHEIRPAL